MEKRNFEIYNFPNGFRLAWQKTPSETIFANLRINHGALHEKGGEEGLAHFLEHLLIEGGTAKYTPEEQARIRGGFGYTNACTSRDGTMIPWGMVSSDLEVYLDMASQMVFYPRLDGKVLEQQKRVVLREIAIKKGSPDFEDIFKFFWPKLARDRDHTYFVLGEEDVIKDVGEVELRGFHGRGYDPNNMYLMLAGNLPQGLVDMVGKYFADKPSGQGKPIEFSQVNPLENKVVRYSPADDLLNKDHLEESNSYLMIGMVVPDEFHGDSASLDVTADVLGRSWTTGLKKRIRSEEGISYDINSFYSGDKRFGWFGVHGKVHAKKQEKAIDIIFEELNKLRTSLLGEDEVLRAKRRVAYNAANYLNSTFRMFVNVDPVNVGAIAKMDYDLEGRVPVREKLSQIEKITPADIKRVANIYLPSDRISGKYVMLVRDPFSLKKLKRIPYHRNLVKFVDGLTKAHIAKFKKLYYPR